MKTRISAFISGFFLILGLSGCGGGIDRPAPVLSSSLKQSVCAGWTSSKPDSYNRVIWLGNEFLVAGGTGTVLTSPDGLSWTSRISGTTAGLVGIDGSGNNVVAVGGPGNLITSFDRGATWSSNKNVNTSSPLYGVTWSGSFSRFIVVGGGGTVLGSSDMMTWTVTSVAQISQRNLYGVTWAGSGTWPGSGTAVAVGDQGTILTSPDGLSWSLQTFNTTKALNRVIWANSQFVAVGDGGTVLTSPDGATWTSRASNTALSLSGVASSGNLLVAVGDSGTILTSSTGGASWATLTSPTANPLFGVTWAGSQTGFVAVGGPGTILTSPDGLIWTIQAAAVGTSLNADSSSGALSVTVGDGGVIQTSLDGKVWSARTSGTIGPLFGVTWSPSQSQFVAVGGNGFITTSTDGFSWSPNQVSATTSALHRVLWTGSQYIAVGGGGTVLTSLDGASWISHNSNVAYPLYGVTWSGSNSLFVATGSGAVLTSPDGAFWTSVSAAPNVSINGAAWGPQFVIVGEFGNILTSTYGVTWTRQISHTSNTLHDVLWSGTQFVASGDNGTILTSPDGVTWLPQPSGTSNALLGLTWTGSQYVAVGGNGTILNSCAAGANSGTPSLSGLPPAPTGVSAVPSNTPGTISLFWQDVPAATSYNVYAGITSSLTPTFGVQFEVAVALPPYDVVNLPQGTQYYFIVTAVNSVGEGPPSAIVSATSPGPPP